MVGLGPSWFKKSMEEVGTVRAVIEEIQSNYGIILETCQEKSTFFSQISGVGKALWYGQD